MIIPKGLNKYVIFLLTSGRFCIYLVPPHKGHCFPVIAKYGHIPNWGIIFWIKVDIIGKKITYIDKIKKVTSEQLKECANKYFTDKSVITVLRP